jgi:putative FmdB family regulatory protein
LSANFDFGYTATLNTDATRLTLRKTDYADLRIHLPACGHAFEHLARTLGDKPAACPSCGAKRIAKQFSTFAPAAAVPKGCRSCADAARMLLFQIGRLRCSGALQPPLTAGARGSGLRAVLHFVWPIIGSAQPRPVESGRSFGGRGCAEPFCVDTNILNSGHRKVKPL